MNIYHDYAVADCVGDDRSVLEMVYDACGSVSFTMRVYNGANVYPYAVTTTPPVDGAGDLLRRFVSAIRQDDTVTVDPTVSASVIDTDPRYGVGRVFSTPAGFSCTDSGEDTVRPRVIIPAHDTHGRLVSCVIFTRHMVGGVTHHYSVDIVGAYGASTMFVVETYQMGNFVDQVETILHHPWGE